MGKFKLKDFVPCEKCNNGFFYRLDSNGDGIAEECDCKKNYNKQIKLELEVYKSGLPPSVINYDINTYIGTATIIDKLKIYIKNFKTKYYNAHLYFWSTINSTQKTTVATWVGRELIKQNYIIRFVLMDTLIKLLQNVNFSDDEELENKIKEYYNADFLVIDDSFDPKKVTLYKSGYQLSYLDSFLRKRIEQLEKATCFTSNISISGIESNFGISMKKFINRNVIDPMEFTDHVNIRTDERIRNFWDE